MLRELKSVPPQISPETSPAFGSSSSVPGHAAFRRFPMTPKSSGNPLVSPVQPLFRQSNTWVAGHIKNGLNRLTVRLNFTTRDDSLRYNNRERKRTARQHPSVFHSCSDGCF